jgi:glycosyltransferase involved in cell wall biosynthesis
VSGDAVRARLGLGADLTIGWAGILRDWHGLELLIEAVAAVHGARLLIVGDGPARPQVEARIAALGATSRVALAGRVPHEEMPAHIAAMDVAVVAADRTGVASPMKLLEYMAMGRAVVAPRLENVRDLVEDEVDGLLFEVGDAGALGAAVRRLAASAPLRQRLGGNARRKVEQARNWRRNAEAVLALVNLRRRTASDGGTWRKKIS